MTATPTTLLILGASGDLTSRLLLPGLATLLTAEPERAVRVVGADRVEQSPERWAALVGEAFAAAGATAGVTDPVAGSTRYVRTDLLDEAELRALLDGLNGPLVLYFALPPQVSSAVCALLESIDLPPGTRLALEKPFGHDLASARALNAQLLRVVPEERIHRIDHFLGVNTVLNLIGLRFANRLLQPVWSAEHIERVDISYDETLALEGRAGYYDRAGALMDMTQSHLLQILALFAMESPATLDAEEVRSLIASALRATRLWGDDPATATRRARYTAGTISGRAVPDYVREEGVDPARETETLSEIVVELRNGRWSGVPFVLRSGKALGRDGKRIVVTFRQPAHVPTGLHDHSGPDRLTLDLKPGAVTLDLSLNAEGDPFDLEPKQLRAELGQARMLPYGEVLGAILDGDQLLTIRADVAEQCWRLVEQVQTAWRSGAVPLQDYPAGSDGPPAWGTIPPCRTGRASGAGIDT